MIVAFTEMNRSMVEKLERAASDYFQAISKWNPEREAYIYI